MSSSQGSSPSVDALLFNLRFVVMQILLASAKIMYDRLPYAYQGILSQPRFQSEAETIALDMGQYSIEALGDMLGCNPQIAAQNKLRYQRFFDEAPQPALLTYHGQAYKHLKAESLTADELRFAQAHLWITSFLYGLLRPLDGIRPYRLEGNITLPCTDGKSLFSFWQSRLTDVLLEAVHADDGILIHLATEEFQHLFDWHRICREVEVIQPLFYIGKGHRLKMQAVWAKSCRGAMTRFLLQQRPTTPSQLQAFCYEQFRYMPHLGEAAFPHFVRYDD